MSREIGSEFDLDLQLLEHKPDNTVTSYLQNYHTVYTESGRSALLLIARQLAPGKVLLPAYLCSSVINCFRKDYQVGFYRIQEDFSIDLEDLKEHLDENTKLVYVMSYFGASLAESSVSELKRLREKYHFYIVEDTTHSLFSGHSLLGDYCICSLRKWLPIPDGGVLYSRKELNISLDEQKISAASEAKFYGMILKTLWLKDSLNFKEYYRKMFADSELILDLSSSGKSISILSKILLEHFNINSLVERRRENYKILYQSAAALGFELPLRLNRKDTPFCLPIYSPKRDLLRQYLIEKCIYCALHWPEADLACTGRKESLSISRKILSLPVDQRYNTEDMEHISKCLQMSRELLV